MNGRTPGSLLRQPEIAGSIEGLIPEPQVEPSSLARRSHATPEVPRRPSTTQRQLYERSLDALQQLGRVAVALVAGLFEQFVALRVLASHVAAEVQRDRERPRVDLRIVERRRIVDLVG